MVQILFYTTHGCGYTAGKNVLQQDTNRMPQTVNCMPTDLNRETGNHEKGTACPFKKGSKHVFPWQIFEPQSTKNNVSTVTLVTQDSPKPWIFCTACTYQACRVNMRFGIRNHQVCFIQSLNNIFNFMSEQEPNENDEIEKNYWSRTPAVICH